jgi:hypothetical protein
MGSDAGNCLQVELGQRQLQWMAEKGAHPVLALLLLVTIRSARQEMSSTTALLSCREYCSGDE